MKVGINISKEGERRREHLPLELRIKLYNEVHRLRKEKLSYSKIIKKINDIYKVQLNL